MAPNDPRLASIANTHTLVSHERYREMKEIEAQHKGCQAAVDTAVAELAAEAERLKEGIRRYMAEDPPHAGDCASMDPYPRRGPCDCGVNDFIRAALGESPT